MTDETFGTWLRGKIAESGLSQNAVAKLVGATSGMMSRWVNDDKTPSHRSALKIAEALALDVDEVLERAGLKPVYLDPLSEERRELLELVRQLPERDLPMFSEFARHRVMRAKVEAVRRREPVTAP